MKNFAWRLTFREECFLYTARRYLTRTVSKLARWGCPELDHTWNSEGQSLLCRNAATKWQGWRYIGLDVRVRSRGTRNNVEEPLPQHKRDRFSWVFTLDAPAGRLGRTGGLRWSCGLVSRPRRGRRRRNCCPLHTPGPHHKLRQHAIGAWNLRDVHLHGSARGQLRSPEHCDYSLRKPSLVGHQHGLGGD